jgi:hypothetical protein
MFPCFSEGNIELVLEVNCKLIQHNAVLYRIIGLLPHRRPQKKTSADVMYS